MSATAVITLLAVLLRWGVSLHPYSGAGKPPMYGDYEAQRHWQEITINLPVQEWYSNSSDNDLLYWGLDYPPLTAYHSYLCGLAARRLDPGSVELHASRGHESPWHKLFMRYTVFVADLLIYFPAAYLVSGVSPRKRAVSMEYLALILYPGLYLVDYGHFQYNSASLGLFLGAVAALARGWDCLGSVLFCLALNYKQMELYHALPIFFYLLGLCSRQGGIWGFLLKVSKLGTSVILTFGAIWAPFLLNPEALLQAFRRLFPIDRGLFEDKVATFWCSLSVLIKIRNLVDNTNMALICLLSTVVCMLPSSVHLFINPTLKHLRYALFNGSLVFFLLSYHVHEKSILLAAVPACLIFGEEPFAVTWFLVVSVFSMLPLMIKDGLVIPLLALTVLMCLVFRYAQNASVHPGARGPFRVWMTMSFYLSLAGLCLLTLASLMLPPPPRLPDLFPVLLSIYSCGHFCLFSLYFHYCQFMLKYNRQAPIKIKVQ